MALTIAVHILCVEVDSLSGSSEPLQRRAARSMLVEVTPRIPTSVRVFTWILICAGSFFFYVYTFDPSVSFPHAALDSYSATLGFGSAGVRILGSVLALAVSVLANDARWLFITLVSRVFIELGDVVLGLLLDGPTANTGALVVLAGLELWALRRLWYVTRRERA